MKKIIALFAAALLFMSISGAGVKAVSFAGYPRHYSFTESIYTYHYNGHACFLNRTAQRYQCDEYHMRYVGGVLFGTKVLTGTHWRD